MALILVTIGPLKPSKTIWSYFFNLPSTRMQSIVVPYPSVIFTSITVQLNLSFFTLIFLTVLGIDVEYFTKSDRISGIP